MSFLQPPSSAPTLSSILEQSQRLVTSFSQHADLPQIELGLDQIASQSRRIAGKGLDGGRGPQGREESNATNWFLASGGVNSDQISSTIKSLANNFSGTFEPLMPLNDTDVDGYLRHTHEQTIISSIEEGRRQTTAAFYKNLDGQMRRNWESQKEKLFEELGRHQPSEGQGQGSLETPRKKGSGGGFDRTSPAGPMPSASGSLQMHSRMMQYDAVVRRLNNYRKQGYSFGLVSAFGNASAGLNGDSRTSETTETWQLLAHLVNERQVNKNGEFEREALSERQYAKAYLAEDQNGADATALRKMIGDGAREHLEKQYMTYVDKTLAAKPAEAGLGGVPSLQNKIRAFINVKYQKQGAWTNPRLEVIDSTPIWARIYYLLRSGHPKEALAFATEKEAQISTLEPSFVSYLKAWLDSPVRRLPKLLRDRFLAEFNQRIRDINGTSDPYKQALYKLIGRLEINRRNVAGVTQTTQDWLWLQLSLVRETDEADDAPHERYGLRDLGRLLIKFGPAHFDPKGNRPELYFQCLLLSGRFERAIAFLHQHPANQVDAVHYAIALSYYGLLRIPGSDKSTDPNLLIVDADGETAHLNFSRLLYRYTRPLVQADIEVALQYLYLVCLNADLPGTLGKEQVALCHDYIRETVMETRKYAELLGDLHADGTRTPGMLERDLKLIHLTSEASYLSSIVRAAALRADHERRFSNSIQLYNLCGDYDAVISVLNAELGRSLALPATSTPSSAVDYFKEGNESLSLAVESEDVVHVARTVLDHFDRQGGMGGKVSRKNRTTCEALMKLKEGMSLFQSGHYDQALAAIEAVNITPLHSDLVAIIRSAEDFKQLDEAIVRNFDGILITTMSTIYKIHTALKESPYGDAGRQQILADLRQKSRSLMTFAGMLRYRLSNDTYAALTRLDVFIH